MDYSLADPIPREPHVGLQVCMPAFEKVSAAKRSTLRQLTGGELRMVGGSADTLYLPGYLRESFLETLDPFLDTDCFLEIAVPTAVHLIRPPSQRITFIDHVRARLATCISILPLTNCFSGGFGRSP